MERWKQAEEEHDDCGHGAGERCGKTFSKCHQKNGQYDHGRRDPEIIYKDIPVKLDTRATISPIRIIRRISRVRILFVIKPFSFSEFEADGITILYLIIIRYC